MIADWRVNVRDEKVFLQCHISNRLGEAPLPISRKNALDLPQITTGGGDVIRYRKYYNGNGAKNDV